MVFGLWRNGHLATYITTVTRNEQVIPNPAIKEEAPQFVDRVKWKGDLSKSLAVFQISHVGSEDQMEFGIMLNFGPFRNLLSDSLRLEVQGENLSCYEKLVLFFSFFQKVGICHCLG